MSATLSGLRKAARGRREADERWRQLIMKAVEEGVTYQEIAQAAGLTKGRISQIVNAHRKVDQ